MPVKADESDRGESEKEAALAAEGAEEDEAAAAADVDPVLFPPDKEVSGTSMPLRFYPCDAKAKGESSACACAWENRACLGAVFAVHLHHTHLGYEA